MASNGATEEVDLYSKQSVRGFIAELTRIELLGVSKTATKTEIKKAWHKVGLFLSLASTCIGLHILGSVATSSRQSA